MVPTASPTNEHRVHNVQVVSSLMTCLNSLDLVIPSDYPHFAYTKAFAMASKVI